jgi:hypothetical protein
MHLPASKPSGPRSAAVSAAAGWDRWRSTWRGGWRWFFLYLLAALVAAVACWVPVRPDPAAAYQLEPVQIPGAGTLTGVARVSLRTTAWLAATTVERQRALLDPTPLASRVGRPLVRALHAWQHGNRPLQWALLLVVMALAAGAAYARAGRRAWLAALLGVLVAVLALTRPASMLEAAGTPGRAMAGLALTILGSPSDYAPPPLGGPAQMPDGPQGVQRQLGDAYWTAFVTAPVSRATTGTPILTQAAPAERAGLLAMLQQRLDGGRGGSGGFQRAFVGVTTLAGISLFTVLGVLLAVTAWSAQTLVFLLVLAGFGLAPWMLNPRRWGWLNRYWLIPLIGALGLTLAAAGCSWFITWLGTWIANSAEWLFSLVAGPLVAGVVGWLAVRVVWRRLRAWLRTLTTVAGAGPAAPDQSADGGKGAQAA